MWNGKRFVTPEDIQHLKRDEETARWMIECSERCDAIRPQVEQLWQEILKSLQNPWRL
jgi:hypothetical protein